MLTSTLLTLALSAPVLQAGAQPAQAPRSILQQPPAGAPSLGGPQSPARRWQAPPVPQVGIFGETRSGGTIESVLGGSFTRIAGPMVAVSGIPAPRVLRLTFNDPVGNGWQESCLVGIPSTPAPNTPLLVMFHGYGVSEMDCYVNTWIFKLALERGWYVVAPLGAHQLNFGIPYSQDNVAFVLDWAQATFPIDPTRIYGVGFSMGGGGLTSYMARHQDPNRPRFAAAVNHTGGVSIANTYANSANTAVLDDPQMFGGSPALFPFEYSQVSLVDILPTTGPFNPATDIDPNTDMARNLAHVPLLDFTVSQEPAQTAYLRHQVLALHGWMQAFNSSAETHLEVFGTTHAWDNLDAWVTLDFLRQQTLTTPRAGMHEVLADREAQWHHFYVHQDSAGAFTPFRWTMVDAQNLLAIDRTQNLKRLVVDTTSIGLHTTVPLSVIFGTQDGQPEELTLDGYPSAPQSVTRGGVPAQNWTWDAPTQSVTLVETNAANFPLWVVTP